MIREACNACGACVDANEFEARGGYCRACDEDRPAITIQDEAHPLDPAGWRAAIAIVEGTQERRERMRVEAEQANLRG